MLNFLFKNSDKSTKVNSLEELYSNHEIECMIDVQHELLITEIEGKVLLTTPECQCFVIENGEQKEITWSIMEIILGSTPEREDVDHTRICDSIITLRSFFSKRTKFRFSRDNIDKFLENISRKDEIYIKLFVKEKLYSLDIINLRVDILYNGNEIKNAIMKIHELEIGNTSIFSASNVISLGFDCKTTIQEVRIQDRVLANRIESIKSMSYNDYLLISEMVNLTKKCYLDFDSISDEDISIIGRGYSIQRNSYKYNILYTAINRLLLARR